MSIQVEQNDFEKALLELGHDPKHYEGKRLSLTNMSELYEIDQDDIVDAINQKLLAAYYDYKNDFIWVDALAAAHFYYCLRDKMTFYDRMVG
jgi:hypothetical protein